MDVGKDGPTLADIQRALGRSPTAVNNLRRRGMPTHSIAAARDWYAANVKTKTGRAVSATVRLREAQARAAELELARKTGQLIDVDEAVALVMEVSQIGATEMAGLPGRAAVELEGKDAAGRKAWLHDEVTRIRRAIVARVEAWAREKDGGRGDGRLGAAADQAA